jgi:hypothetical protein
MTDSPDPKKSHAVSAQYNVTCPVCNAQPLTPCRTLRTGRVTDTHLARIEARYGSTLTRVR